MIPFGTDPTVAALPTSSVLLNDKWLLLTYSVQARLATKGSIPNDTVEKLLAHSEKPKKGFRKTLNQLISKKDFKGALKAFSKSGGKPYPLLNGLELLPREKFEAKFKSGIRRWRARWTFSWNRSFGGFGFKTEKPADPTTETKSNGPKVISTTEFKPLTEDETAAQTKATPTGKLQLFDQSIPLTTQTDWIRPYLADFTGRGNSSYSSPHISYLEKHPERSECFQLSTLDVDTNGSKVSFKLIAFKPPAELGLAEIFYALEQPEIRKKGIKSPYLFSVNSEKNRLTLYSGYMPEYDPFQKYPDEKVALLKAIELVFDNKGVQQIRQSNAYGAGKNISEIVETLKAKDSTIQTHCFNDKFYAFKPEPA